MKNFDRYIKKTSFIQGMIFATLFSSVVTFAASTLNSAGIWEFNSGDVISASEINDNFEQLSYGIIIEMSADVNVAYGTTVHAAFDHVVKGTASIDYDTTNYELTIPVGKEGFYSFFMKNAVAITGAGGGSMQVFVNGTYSTGVATDVSDSVSVYLNAGDVVSIRFAETFGYGGGDYYDVDHTQTVVGIKLQL